MDRQTDLAGRQPDRLTDLQTDDGQTDSQPDRQADRQRPTNRQRDRQMDGLRKTDKGIKFLSLEAHEILFFLPSEQAKNLLLKLSI